MGVTGPVAIVEDARYRLHRAPAGHPERPDRLAAVADAVARHEAGLQRFESRPADDAELLRVHDGPHLAAIEAAVGAAPGRLDADTYVSPESLDVARLAAGTAVDLTRAVARGELRAGLAALRPPGHHAEAGRAMGFCLFNNVAVAARALQAEDRIDRILILDWDVHHGNGTQHSFEDDPGVLYASTHQFPFYPGTGAFDEAGTGTGRGATLNIPLPAGCGDAEYVGAIRRIVAPALLAWKPDILLISCGFDAHRDDPLGAMQVSREGFLAMARAVRRLADALCEGRVVFLLEGGYAASGLREGTDAVLEALLEDPAESLVAAPEPEAGTVLRAAVEAVAQVHGGHFAGLGGDPLA